MFALFSRYLAGTECSLIAHRQLRPPLPALTSNRPIMRSRRQGSMSWPSAQFVSLEALTRQLSYHAIPLPKLDVVSVNKLLCRFDCCAVVTTIKNYRFHEMTVAANYVCSVVGHITHAGSGGSTTELSVTEYCRGTGR